ncbi:MAG TPA: type VI secretion system membrane subunit TssM [Steroidobacter sp.]|uniref:type VI secretion system membrane subunit TssM n=1 Tax=Steroidobacter sp. TaxID=1978227 RepID=UPI002ED9D4D5
MLALLKNRTLLALVGLILLAAFIWFAGPYFAFAELKPLDGVLERVVAILIVVIAWTLVLLLKHMRSARASSKLADEVVAQGATAQDADPAAARAGDAAQLRKRFEEAIDALKKSKKKGAANLYELPWYVIIGPPGAGKTTVLVNSGLDFPLAQKFGKDALRGVGGTRHCDWWFTDKAILLDTAGRYTTQDSNARADAAGWVAFLQLLRKSRSRQPINGVIVAMSASDLLTSSEQERERHVIAIRERLAELGRTLGIDVPVYFLVTKCDLVAGFSEFFDELGQEARAQVWGTTFPIEVTEAGQAPATFEKEFERLIERLQQRVLPRIDSERDPRRRVGILAFPQQMAAFGPLLNDLLRRVFTTTDFEEQILLRGVYFTSGTQEGTPVDRVLGSIARTFGVSGAVAPAAAGRGKAFFIERLLKNVVFQESGLAGINRRLQLWKFGVQAAAYVACAAVLVLGLVSLTMSYKANATYVGAVGTAAATLDATRLGPEATSLPAEALLPRLDALRNVTNTAEQYQNDVPFRMRVGLYQGNTLGGAAREAYLRELNNVLLPVMAARFAEQVRASVAVPDRLYEYLKAYLMLGDAEHRDADHLRVLADIELRRMYPQDTSTRERLADHFAQLLADEDGMRLAHVDAQLVEQARYALRTASLPVLMYSRLKLSYAADEKRALRLDLAAGPGAETVLMRTSGAALSEPVPALYTRDVFQEVNTTGKYELLKHFAADAWVFGSNLLDARNSGLQLHEMINLYEQDYIRTWDGVLRDVKVRPMASAAELTDQLGILSSPASPLKGFLAAAAENTNLLKPAAETPAPGAVGAAAASLASKASQLANVLGAPPPGAAEPGTAVTKHFEPIRRLTQGPPGAAPIDAVLGTLAQTHKQLQSIGSGLGDTSALDAVVKSGQADALKSLQLQARQLPEPIGAMVAQIGSRSESIAMGQARGDLSRRYEEQVMRECRELVEGRYPLVRSSANDVPLEDFGRVFGYNGTFDTFFRDNLAALVDVSRTPWSWRSGAASIGGSPEMLRQFQQARRIRDVYFKPGSQTPEARFTLTPDVLDSAVTRFSLELDGQRFEYRHGPQQSSSMTWPGGAVGQTAVVFEAAGGSGPSLVRQGPWAWFRVLDQAQIKRVSDTRFNVTLAAGGRSMQLVLDAASIRNPFVRDELAGFRCAM